MRLIVTLILGLILLGFNSQAVACEHGSQEIISQQDVISTASFNHHVQSISGSALTVNNLHIDYCCSAAPSICCLAVPFSLRVVKSADSISEEISHKRNNYKSFVAYTMQRPPCSETV